MAPGGSTALDQPAPVPTTCGSATGGDYDPVTCPQGTPPGGGRGFEISLSQHLSDTLVAADGSRSLYLDVRGLDGASHNGFALWAGPPSYTDTLSSAANLRHLWLVDDPNSYSSEGVQIWATGPAPQRALYDGAATIPLAYAGPEYSGLPLAVSLFDPDASWLDLSFDTVAPADYHLSWSANCNGGGCDDRWTTPALTMAIPTFDEGFAFYGGAVLAQYQANAGDTLTWQVERPTLQTITPQSEACMAFPIALPDSLYSVYPSDVQVAEPYDRFPTRFTYPNYLSYTTLDPSNFWQTFPVCLLHRPGRDTSI